MAATKCLLLFGTWAVGQVVRWWRKTFHRKSRQPNEFKASSSGGNVIDVTYSFADPGNSDKNAGHVFAITNNLDSTRSQTLTYHQLNHLTSALTTSTYGRVARTS